MIFDKKEREEDEENKENGKNKNLYDEIVPESVSIDDVIGMHDMKYMQVHSGTGKKDKVDRRMDASTFVSFLIFAMLLICGKTLHEQSRQITRLSKLSQPSLFSQLQPEVLLSLTSSCFLRLFWTISASPALSSEAISLQVYLHRMTSGDVANFQPIRGR